MKNNEKKYVMIVTIDDIGTKQNYALDSVEELEELYVGKLRPEGALGMGIHSREGFVFGYIGDKKRG